MIKRLFCLLVVIVSLCAPQASAAPPKSADSLAAQTKDCTVYVTRTGARYHRAGCSSLRKSAIPMTRSEAIKRGYAPCKRCGGSDCER
jgi:methylphosphotriester-DNA--protein-cysteine methyltransferase